MGLIARAIERVGIPTVSISITKDLTEAVGIPRALFVKWPLGHPMGERGHVAQQRTLIFDALTLLREVDAPGCDPRARLSMAPRRISRARLGCVGIVSE